MFFIVYLPMTICCKNHPPDTEFEALSVSGLAVVGSAPIPLG